MQQPKPEPPKQIILRASMTNILEQRVCGLSKQYAREIANRMFDLNMLNIMLPMSYVVKVGKLPSGEAGTFLMKVTDQGEFAINEKDPIVEFCLTFATDVQKGLMAQIMEFYRARYREVFRANRILEFACREGIEKFDAEIDLTNIDEQGNEIQTTDETEGSRFERIDTEPAGVSRFAALDFDRTPAASPLLISK